MKYEIIDAKDAPTLPKPASKGAAEATSIVKQLKRGSVARVEPDADQTIRGLRVNLSRAAKTAGVKLQTWDKDDILYVKLV